MHLVGFTTEMYYDARPHEREICCFVLSAYVNWYSERMKMRSMGDLKEMSFELFAILWL